MTPKTSTPRNQEFESNQVHEGRMATSFIPMTKLQYRYAANVLLRTANINMDSIKNGQFLILEQVDF